ncbi:MAG: hypothetical protein ISS78_06785 [Phycisphaerae bacterium]|nr:hypothetical protein [Phycisphaerae bacterium]
MAPQHGTKDSRPDRPESLGSFLARTVAFLLLAAFGLAIVTGVALLPAYARLNEIALERDRIAASNKDDQSRIEAQDRLIEDLPNDRILAKRLTMRHFGSMPRDEYVVAATEDLRAPAPGTVYIEETPQPEPTEDWMTTLAAKLNRPNGVMVLTILAFAALAAAIILTNTPRRRTDPRAAATAPPKPK